MIEMILPMLILAVSLDLTLGDPRSFPHPVRYLGRFARHLEKSTRSKISSPLLAGALTALIIYVVSFTIPWILVELSSLVSNALAIITGAFIIYTTIALKDLLGHAKAVEKALRSGNIIEAREKVAMMVGRDTINLNEEEIVRATVESVAENMVDGVTAPLFYAVFLGPSAAMLYRAVNTLDSIFGYRNERYLYFGRVSARVDDIANFIPARITSPLVAMAALILNLSPNNAIKVWLRDGRKHPSPNSGLSEAACAGALRVRLGGLSYYKGLPSEKPYLGDAILPLNIDSITHVNNLVMTTSLLTLCVYLVVFQLISFLQSFL